MNFRFPAWLPWLFLGLAAADLIAVKTGVLNHAPGLVAGFMVLALAGFVVEVGRHGLVLVRGGAGAGQAAGRLLLSAGVVGVLVAGSANWLLSLQGYVILTEGETARLHGGADLQQFDAGPWADPGELGIVLGLDEFELKSGGQESFSPSSRLKIWRGHGKPAILTVDPESRGLFGSLRFHQGAFGFAPRIVILKDEEPARNVFDRTVPFLTERRGARGIAFYGSFNLEAEGLAVDGAIDLDSLDEAMRGHATLRLTVRRGEEVIGRGNLIPGHFADLEDGYRIGFVGLKRWSEVVISRRNYSRFVLIGAGVALIGAFLWALSCWRAR